MNMEPLEHSKHHGQASSEKLPLTTASPSLPGTTSQELCPDKRDSLAAEIEVLISSPPLAFDTDKLAISANLQGGSQRQLSSYVFVDGAPIDQQPTWIIPALKVPQKTRRPKVWDQGEREYGSVLHKLISNSGIYALATLASPLVSLLLAPLLTHTLSRNDYGALAILNTFIVLLSGVTQFGLNSAFFRAYEQDFEADKDRPQVISTLFILLLVVSLIASVATFFAASPLASVLLNAPSLSDAIRICALAVFVQNLTVPGLCWLRAESRTVFFSSISIINLLVNAGTTILLVGFLHMGIEGALFGSVVGYSVIVLSTTPLIVLRAGVRLRFDIARSMVMFSFPNVLNLLSTWVLQLLDRYLLGLLGSLAQTASYAIAYSIGGVLSATIISPFSLAWWVIMYRIAKRDDAQHVFQMIFRWFGFITLCAAFGLSIFGVILLDLFFPPSYQPAAPVIPIVALSMVFNGATIVMTLGASLQRKTWLSTIGLVFAAIVNTLFNFILIPPFGEIGAAIATLIGYAAQSMLGYFINQRIYPVPFEIWRFLLAMMLGIALYVGSLYLGQSQGRYVGWGISIGFFIVYSFCLLLLAKPPLKLFGMHGKHMLVHE